MTQPGNPDQPTTTTGATTGADTDTDTAQGDPDAIDTGDLADVPTDQQTEVDAEGPSCQDGNEAGYGDEDEAERVEGAGE